MAWLSPSGSDVALGGGARRWQSAAWARAGLRASPAPLYEAEAAAAVSAVAPGAAAGGAPAGPGLVPTPARLPAARPPPSLSPMQGAELRDGEAAAAAASYRVLSRLLGYGEAAPEPGPPPPPPGHGPPPPPFLARPGPRGSRPPQLMVFRNVGRPPEEEDVEAAPEPGPSELLCPRHRCALDPKALPPGLALERTWGPAAGLEAQLAALGLGQPAGPGVKTVGGGCCPCPCPPQPPPPQPQPPAVAPQAGEDPTETSDALLVLEGLESEAESLETNSCSEEELSSPGRGGGGGGRLLLQPPGPELPPVPFPLQDLVPLGRLSRGEQQQQQQQQPPPPPPPPGPLRPLAGPSRKGSFKIRLSRLFRTKSCNGGSGGGDGTGKRPAGELAASAASLTDMGGSAGRELDAGR